jgi:hypothetical protein
MRLKFLKKLMGSPEVKRLLSDGHFSVDGALLQAWASHASLEQLDGKDDPSPPPSGPGKSFISSTPGKKRTKGDFRGIKLSNKTHRSSTNSVALLCRKSKAHPALPSHLGHVLTDKRHTLIVDCEVIQVNALGNEMPPRQWWLTSPVPTRRPSGVTRTTTIRGWWLNSGGSELNCMWLRTLPALVVTH